MPKSRAEEILEASLKEAEETIKAQQEVIEQLKAGPWVHGTVAERRAASLMVAVPGQGMVEVPLKSQKAAFEAGDVVRVNGNLALTEAVEGLAFGPIASVTEVGAAHGPLQTLEVSVSGNKLTVFAGKLIGCLEEGDDVLLDPAGAVVRQKVARAKPRFALDGGTGIAWHDIIGLDAAKRTLRDAIEFPVKHGDTLRRWHRKPMKGIALDGPPGCGKTMLAKAAATAIAELYDAAAAASGFIYVKGPEILNKWVGESESTIRGLFTAARKHKARHGYPSVLFIDEADAVLRKRGTGRSSDMESTIVPMFLAEMDGLEESAALVLLATNRIDVLDPAILREGRIDRKLMIGRPDEQTAGLMFVHYMKALPMEADVDMREVALTAAHAIFVGDNYPLGDKRQLRDEISGAMIAGIVERATDMAIGREVESGAATGLSWRDMEMATAMVWQEHVSAHGPQRQSAWRSTQQEA